MQYTQEYKGSLIGAEVSSGEALIYVDNRLYLKCNYRFLDEALRLVKQKVDAQKDLNTRSANNDRS